MEYFLTENKNQENPKDKLYSVKQWAETHDFLTEGAIRALIFNAKKNGFDRVVKRIGGRVFISENAFYQWVDDIQANGGRYA